jgi:DNA-binding MarR family transcriptional regulator
MSAVQRLDASSSEVNRFSATNQEIERQQDLDVERHGPWDPVLADLDNALERLERHALMDRTVPADAVGPTAVAVTRGHPLIAQDELHKIRVGAKPDTAQEPVYEALSQVFAHRTRDRSPQLLNTLIQAIEDQHHSGPVDPDFFPAPERQARLERLGIESTDAIKQAEETLRQEIDLDSESAKHARSLLIFLRLNDTTAAQIAEAVEVPATTVESWLAPLGGFADRANIKSVVEPTPYATYVLTDEDLALSKRSHPKHDVKRTVTAPITPSRKRRIFTPCHQDVTRAQAVLNDPASSETTRVNARVLLELNKNPTVLLRQIATNLDVEYQQVYNAFSQLIADGEFRIKRPRGRRRLADAEDRTASEHEFVAGNQSITESEELGNNRREKEMAGQSLPGAAAAELWVPWRDDVEKAQSISDGVARGEVIDGDLLLKVNIVLALGKESWLSSSEVAAKINATPEEVVHARRELKRDSGLRLEGNVVRQAVTNAGESAPAAAADLQEQEAETSAGLSSWQSEQTLDLEAVRGLIEAPKAKVVRVRPSKRVIEPTHDQVAYANSVLQQPEPINLRARAHRRMAQLVVELSRDRSASNLALALKLGVTDGRIPQMRGELIKNGFGPSDQKAPEPKTAVMRVEKDEVVSVAFESGDRENVSPAEAEMTKPAKERKHLTYSPKDGEVAAATSVVDRVNAGEVVPKGQRIRAEIILKLKQGLSLAEIELEMSLPKTDIYRYRREFAKSGFKVDNPGNAEVRPTEPIFVQAAAAMKTIELATPARGAQMREELAANRSGPGWIESDPWLNPGEPANATVDGKAGATREAPRLEKVTEPGVLKPTSEVSVISAPVSRRVKAQKIGRTMRSRVARVETATIAVDLSPTDEEVAMAKSVLENNHYDPSRAISPKRHAELIMGYHLVNEAIKATIDNIAHGSVDVSAEPKVEPVRVERVRRAPQPRAVRKPRKSRTKTLRAATRQVDSEWVPSRKQAHLADRVSRKSSLPEGLKLKARVLRAFYKKPDVTQSVLAVKFDVTPGRISQIRTELKERGLQVPEGLSV